MATFTDDQLRRLVRQVIDQHLPEARTAAAAPAPLRPAGPPSAHPSHLILVVEDAGDGPCVIEPALPCTHCGYCKSLGH